MTDIDTTSKGELFEQFTTAISRFESERAAAASKGRRLPADQEATCIRSLTAALRGVAEDWCSGALSVQAILFLEACRASTGAELSNLLGRLDAERRQPSFAESMALEQLFALFEDAQRRLKLFAEVEVH